jgi:basic membrane protein A
MKKPLMFRVLIIITLILAMGLSGCTPAGNDTEKTKIAFIYVGPVGDGGWTYAHNLGRLALEEEVPNLEVTILESIPENPVDVEKVLTDLAEAGNKIIFATSFGYMNSVIKIAEEYPDVKFLHCSGYLTAENVGTYFGRMYQARYLSGIVAGKMTSNNVIGYVAAFPIPEVVRGINAFTLGVRSVNPNAVVKVVWTNTWYDPVTEKDAAVSLLEAGGADVIAQHQDTPFPQQAAQEKGAYSVGYNTDMRQFAPNAVLTSPVWHWEKYYIPTVKAILDGTWESNQYWGHISEGIVDLSPYGSMVPQDVIDLVNTEKQALIDGDYDVFTGPIKDQSGTIRVPAGTTMSDADMLGFNWFVEGVIGTIQ